MAPRLQSGEGKRGGAKNRFNSRMMVVSSIQALIAQHMPRGGYRHQVMLLSGGTAMGQALVVVSTPVWTRLYSPNEMGLFAVFMACLFFASTAVTLCYEQAIPNAADDASAAPVLLLAIAASLPCSVILSAAFFVLIRADVLSLGQLPGWAAAGLLLGLIGMGIFGSLRFWSVRQKGFGTISSALVTQGTVRGLLPVLLGLCHMNWAGLMLGELAARLAGLSAMLRGAWPHLEECLRDHGWRKVIAAARRYRAFPGLLLPSSLLGALAGALPVPLVAYYYGAAAAGIFFVAQRLTSMPVSFITASIADVFHARIADAARNAPGDLRPIMLKTMRRLAQMALVVFLPTAALAPMLCKSIFGSQYEQVGILVAILTPWYVVDTVSGPVSRLLLVVNRNEVPVLYNTVSLAGIVLGLCLGHSQGLSFLQAMTVVAAIKTLACVIYGALILKAAQEFGKCAAGRPAVSRLGKSIEP